MLLSKENRHCELKVESDISFAHCMKLFLFCGAMFSLIIFSFVRPNNCLANSGWNQSYTYPKYYKNSNEFWYFAVFWLSGQYMLKISAILLKYPTFKGVFYIFMGKANKIRNVVHCSFCTKNLILSYKWANFKFLLESVLFWVKSDQAKLISCNRT